ncbi:hypothetical protein IFM89_016977 [Coptis chinensis]|uniref:Uncharacterized protein n=1 Tax=Coptis chinensis TaxID=261450 RepID=A0A835HT20_9MAGN|nr:hypothetical protein IFM89_016977 [Coptis chinensis]
MSDSKFMSQEKTKPGSKVGAKGITNNGAEVYSEERREVGFPNGYQENLSSSLITHSDGKKKPLHTTSTDEGFVTKTEPVVESTRVPMVTTHENASSKILAPVPPTDVSKVQTEETQTRPLSNLYWWHKPSPNVGTYNYSLPNDSPIKRRGKPSDNLHGRNEKIAAMTTVQSHVSPPMDSREAARRYGGLSTDPMDNFTTAIDSRHAAWKYRGEIL